MATGIKDRVAVIGMGCCRFGERWDASAEDLMVEAFEEALQDAKIEKNQIIAMEPFESSIAGQRRDSDHRAGCRRLERFHAPVSRG